jgi:hypothetical protein
MFKEYTEMFKPICDFMKDTTSVLPMGDHSQLFKTSVPDSLSALQETLRESELSDAKRANAEKLYEFLQSMYEQYLQKASNPDWTNMPLEERQRRIQELCSRPQVEQRTDAWYKQTANVLTASEFSSLFGTPRQRTALIASKANFVPREYIPQLAFPTSELNALTWGIRFEPVVKQILERKWKAKIKDLGRLLHPTNSRLAASPDGLITEAEDPKRVGRLVEIKCPFSRKVGGEIPFEYWIQMQVQMECADMDECEYFEVELLSKRPEQQDDPDLSHCKEKGQILLWRRDEDYDYEYLGLDIPHQEHPVKDGWELVERIPWGIHRYSHKTVQRDRAWMKSTEPWTDAFWEDVNRMKRGELAPPTPVQKLKVNVCLIRDEEEEIPTVAV